MVEYNDGEVRCVQMKSFLRMKNVVFELVMFVGVMSL